MFLRSCLLVIALVGAMSASAVELFWVGESQPQRFDTRLLSAKGFGAAVVHDGGRLTSDASWAANAVHIVYGTLVVETNVTLTIQAGAVVQFAGGGIYARGEYIANGVHFADAASDEVVSYVLKGNVVTDGATTFRGLNYQDDFQRHSDSSSFAFDTRGLLGKAPSGTVVHWGGRLSENETWVAGQTHLVYGSVTVSTNVTLTVERGAVVKFAGGGIRADGSLVAEGALFADLDDDSVGGDTRKDGWTQPHVSYAIDGEVHDDANTVYRCLDTHGEWLLDGASAASAFNTRGYGAADLAEAVTHEGAVTFDETWSASETHVVYGTLYVAAGVTLTIEPGAVVRFVGGGLVVDGRCVARGVTFTDLDDDSHGATRANAKLPEASYVLEGEIETDDATVMMCSKGNQNDLADPGVSRVFRLETDLERVRFAGVPREVTFDAAWDGSSAVEVTETHPDGSTVVLTNGTADCAGVLLWDAGETPGLYTLRHVTDTNELSASFYRLFNAKVHSGSITGATVWEANITHVVDGMIKVMSGATLLIEPGAVVKFVEGASLTVADGGSCVAKDVTFTPLGDDTVGGDTMFDGKATVPTQDAYAVNGVEDDETTEYRYMTPPSLVTSGTLNKDTTWKGWNVYRITGDLTIASGVTLTIMPGAIVKFDDGKSLTVASGGTLSAIGTRAQPIVFTSVKDDTVGGDTNGDGGATKADCGDWKEIVVSGSFNANYVNILYGAGGGASDTVDAIKIYSGGVVEMKNSRLEHLQRYAVCDEGGSSHFENCVINDAYMAFRHGSGYRDVFDNCVIHDCSYLSNNGGQVFRNCIVANLTTDWQWGTQYGLVLCQNCVFWNKDAKFGPQALPNVQSGSKDNSWADPMFMDSGKGDFRIAESSPCIDAGDGTVAPVADWYGQPRKTNLMVEQTGAPNAKGEYVDIGICEVQPRNVKSDIDLSLVSVTADASATIGGTLNISWAVENLGSANATGSWRDTFELIDASGATIKLGSYTVSGGIVAGGKRVFTTKFNVPSAAVGAARLRVKVNAERDVFEGMIMENNVAVAGGTIDLALATYTPDECSTLVVGAGSSTALTIPADSGITALIIRGGAGVSAYGAYGYMPKALRNDSAAVRLEDGSLLLTLPSTDSADDFTFVIANGGYGAETVSIEPVTESLEITEVTPNRLANTGDGYLTLRGIALDRVAQVKLLGNSNLVAEQIRCDDAGELQALFRLADAAVGSYDLVVETVNGDFVTRNNCIEIFKPLQGAKLEYELSIPNAIRSGRVYSGILHYRNSGDDLMLAPLFLISTEAPNELYYCDDDVAKHALEIVGVGKNGAYVMPNESCSIKFSFRVFRNGALKLGTSVDAHTDWQSLKSYTSDVVDAIDRLRFRGQSVMRSSEVIGLAKSISRGEQVAAIVGRIRDQFGSPIQNASVVFSNHLERVVCRSDQNGNFVSAPVSNGEYLLASFINNQVSTNIVEVKDNSDAYVDLVVSGPVCAVVNVLNDTDAIDVVARSRDDFRQFEGLRTGPGVFEFVGLPDGKYTVVAKCEDQFAAAYLTVVGGDSKYPIYLEMRAASSVYGKISGVSIADSWAVILDGMGMGEMIFPLDKDGNYNSGLIPSGEYSFSVLSANGEELIFIDSFELLPEERKCYDVTKETMKSVRSSKKSVLSSSLYSAASPEPPPDSIDYMKLRDYGAYLYNNFMPYRPSADYACSHNISKWERDRRVRNDFGQFLSELDQDIADHDGLNWLIPYLKGIREVGMQAFKRLAHLFRKGRKLLRAITSLLSIITEITIDIGDVLMTDPETSEAIGLLTEDLETWQMLLSSEYTAVQIEMEVAKIQLHLDQLVRGCKRLQLYGRLKKIDKVMSAVGVVGDIIEYIGDLNDAWKVGNEIDAANVKLFSAQNKLRQMTDGLEIRHRVFAYYQTVLQFNDYSLCCPDAPLLLYGEIEYEKPYSLLKSCDPNEMAGPMGVGDPETERFVKPGEWLTYTVYFENQSNATAAAQEVYVTNPLSEWLDLDSFEMGEVAFNNQIDLGLVGAQNGSCETDLAGTAYRVRTNVTLDRELSTVGWYLRIVDPTTPAEWPEDPYAGLLPPNDETHRGEGHLTYRIKVREDAPRNTVITNLASIVFDYNEAIETDPFWWNIAGWPFTLGEAVNNETLEWMTGGAAEWLPTWDDCATDGLHDAVVTGISNNTNSWIKTIVDGPGTVSFAWCATLASRNTKVQFLVDGAVEAILSGSNGWERASVTVYGEGEHELMWKMQTGRSGASADDFAALDCVGWRPAEPPTLAEALNEDLVWDVDGDAEWHGVARDSLVSAREAWASVSGLGDYEYAAVETRVYGSGTLRFEWAVSCEEMFDELVLFVDGDPRKSITGEVSWKPDAVEIAGRTWHTVRWEYVKDELDEPELVGDNRAMLDNVVWTSDDEPPRFTETTPVPVPFEEIEAKYKAYLDAAGGDYEAAAMATGRNGCAIWESYVAGLDPDDPESKFRITEIKFEDGEIRITGWEPNLKGERSYTEYGRTELGGEEAWTKMSDVPATERKDYRFRKVTVGMP